jgi:hypothetical protein
VVLEVTTRLYTVKALHDFRSSAMRDYKSDATKKFKACRETADFNSCWF